MDIRQVENLTIAETVETFRIGRTKLYSLIATGDIEAIKLGRRTLINAQSVRSFLAELPRLNAELDAE